MTPGVSFTLVTDRVLATGVRAGLAVIAGTTCGLLTHALLAGLGLSALVMRSASAFLIVKLVGAVYLVAIGLQALRASTKPVPAVGSPPTGRSDLLQGYLGNVLNPKAAAIYLTLAPQFLDRTHPLLPQLMLLSAAHVAVAAGWLLSWTAVVHLSSRTLRTPRFRTTMSRVAGLVLITLGLQSVLHKIS
ncbi:LysE family translocator [Kribbella antibiotica]|uniref:LysE family translocator n=1 Tax=Kribbella antibiotica TaxID=190195 RepID=A0A4R4ZX93_9ACTN|nr:LysE family translocator [Kribbella antibiotica]